MEGGYYIMHSNACTMHCTEIPHISNCNFWCCNSSSEFPISVRVNQDQHKILQVTSYKEHDCCISACENEEIGGGGDDTMPLNHCTEINFKT